MCGARHRFCRVNRETLEFRNRTRRHNSNRVPHLRSVARIVREEFLRADAVLLVLCILHITVDLHRGRVFHRRLYDDADE